MNARSAVFSSDFSCERILLNVLTSSEKQAVDPSEAQRVEAAIGDTGLSGLLPAEKKQEVKATVDLALDSSRIQRSTAQTVDGQNGLKEQGVSGSSEGVKAAATTDVDKTDLPSSSSTSAVQLTTSQDVSSKASAPLKESNAADSNSVVQGPVPSPPGVISIKPQTLSAGPPSDAATTPSRSLSARNQEKKEPAVLGEFVSLGDMEGRQHLRFASKSPEAPQPTASDSPPPRNDSAPSEPVVAPKPLKPAFTPFLSVITGGPTVPPSPSGSNSSKRDKSQRKSPPSPSDEVNVPSEAEAERRKKRSRDAVSPSSSAASFQTASSRIDETMARNKKSRKLADRLHDKPPGERELQVEGAAEVGEPSTSSGTKDNGLDQSADPASATSPENGRTSSESMDMDIDNDETPPATKPADQQKTDPKTSGAAAFNPDQDDFMALDVSDDDEDAFQPLRFAKPDAVRGQARRGQPQAFPDRGPSDKRKGKATGEAMVGSVHSAVKQGANAIPCSVPNAEGSWHTANRARGVSCVHLASAQDIQHRCVSIAICCSPLISCTSTARLHGEIMYTILQKSAKLLSTGKLG